MQEIERYLYSYGDIKRQIRDKEQQIEEIVAHKNSVADRLLKAPNYSDICVKGCGISDPVYKAVQKMIDVYGSRIEVFTNELIELYSKLDEIQRFVDDAGLSGIEREFVRLRYFEGLKVREISSRMNYSIRWCKDRGSLTLIRLKCSKTMR